ncbi:uncharacterized protein LOC144652320 isoform X2 [Oculina patagonica]
MVSFVCIIDNRRPKVERPAWGDCDYRSTRADRPSWRDRDYRSTRADRPSRRDRGKGRTKDDLRNNLDLRKRRCFNCRGYGHVKADCPSQTRRKRPSKRTKEVQTASPTPTPPTAVNNYNFYSIGGNIKIN